MITFGSLFAGIGGFDLGFERAGIACKWQVEIDDFASKVLAKHWPDVHRERDILQCGGHNLEPVDVICGGFPCQDISYAGRGAGLDGERSRLFFEAVRVVCELQPRCVVLENVAALLSRGLDRVLGTLAEIGYDAEWHCIPAVAVGAPHIRDRVFVIGRSRAGIVGDTDSTRCGSWTTERSKCSETIQPMPATGSEDVAYAKRHTTIPKSNMQTTQREVESSRRIDVARCGMDSRVRIATDSGWWATEPDVGRVAHGVPARVDRIRGLGNAVVPQVAEFVAREFVLPMFQSEGAECT